MTTQQIAERLSSFCQKGQFEAAQKELFAQDAVSIEPYATPAFEKETHGLDAIIKKGHKFDDMVSELHDIAISEPLISGDSFAIRMDMDITMKGRERERMAELCVYRLKDGKIVSEQFFM